MKKTLTLLLAAVATLSMTAANLFTPSEAQMGTPVKMENVKQAPAAMQAKMMARLASKLKATPNFPASTAADLVGGYAWTYRQYTGGMTTQPDTISNNYTFQRDTEDNVDLVGINKISDTQIRLTGFMPFPVTATMGTTSGYTTFTVDENQVVYTHSTYGDCTLAAAWYYEGDDTYSAGWYVGDVMGILVDEGIVMDPDVHFYLVIKSGTYANYRLGWIYEPGSTMVPVTDFNAMMSFTYNTRVYDWPVIATENNETYVVSVDNFAGIGTTPVNFTLAEDKTWTADQAVFYTSGDNNFAFANTTDYGVVTGTGTEKVLTFGQNWTGFDANTNYWLGERSATTITLISDEEFVYPTPAPEKAYYLIGGFNEWNQEAMIPFEENDGVFTLTYTFGGEFKVKDEAGNWWGGGVTLTEENPSVTLIDGNNLNLDQQAEYTLTIEDGVLTVTGFPAPQVVEYNDFFVCGSFNNWSQTDGLVELTLNEEGTEFAGSVELEAGAEFKLISHNLAGGWKWFGGSTNGDNFLITPELLGGNIALVDGSNFQVQEAGKYDIIVKQASSKGLQEPLVMVITKNTTPTAINTIGTDAKADNAYYNLMGVKFNGMPSTPGIYIHNGHKVVIK
ncbi:MAG: hypothetical protein IJG81_04485 [Muribaculaceae bacterium]|nr:hypothetical protein [Muribaculaceae bacterium]